MTFAEAQKVWREGTFQESDDLLYIMTPKYTIPGMDQYAEVGVLTCYSILTLPVIGPS